MKKMKLLALAIFSLWMVTANAQPDGPPPMGEKKEQIEAMKVAFLTRKLDLTPTEAQTFWPVYNQFQNELDKLRDSHRKEIRDAKSDFENMTDKDVEKVVDGEIAFRQTELDILKKYHAQFKKVLPLHKVARLYRAEEEFKRDLLKKIQERKESGGRPGPRPR